MGIFDQIKNVFKSEINREVRNQTRGAINNLEKQIGKGMNKSEKFKFQDIPSSLEELQALPEAKLDSPYKTAALVMLTLMNYERNPEETARMLDFLNGPNDVSNHVKQFLKEHLGEKPYKAPSFFEGATVQNNYTPNVPYVITISENPYSFDNKDWATLWVKSAGGDNPRPIIFRHKPSTNEWFFTEIQCLTDIRTPVKDDPWA